ncbi:peptide-methionine (R)-S-oxide reductase MsrB [Poriferisphaera sp. WC338]|uniref:peptide-methionine (R)-S-oxide reductase MsrB n=1 Tax=Poriferisphaera sp. WC338 TaxID=3425129 RepID=UPI003D81C1A1
MMDKINLTDAEWKQKLTPEEYNVLRKKGTERAFTGDLLDKKTDGTYVCAGCGQELFAANTKFESGSGWPSFYDVVNNENVELETDQSHGMTRTEVMCSRCGGHLGHVFNDGPAPTGLRYCINSVSLNVKEK